MEDQLALFIRHHHFFAKFSVGGKHTTSERRSFERDVYDVSRDHGFSRREAKRQVIRARQFCGEVEYDSDTSALGNEISDELGIEFEPSPDVDKDEMPDSDRSLGSQEGSASPSQLHSSSETSESQKIRKRKLDQAYGDGDDPALPKKKHAPSRPEKRRGSRGRSDEGYYHDGSKSDSESSPSSVISAKEQGTSEKRSIEVKSRLSDVDREHRKESKRQRRMKDRAEKTHARQDLEMDKSSTHDNSTEDVGTDTEPGVEHPGPAVPTEPKTQAEAHENFVRSNRRDPHDGGPSTKKGKKNRRQAREEQKALDAEIRALNTDVNEQQIEDYDHGQLAGATRAVKDDVKLAKVIKRRIQDDENAGLRKVEQSLEAAAKKELEHRRTKDPPIEPSESGPKKSKRRKRKAQSDIQSPRTDFPTPMIQ